MLGSDIERMLSGINAVKDTTESQINKFAYAMAYRITTPDHVNEQAVPVFNPMTPIMSTYSSSLNSDAVKMDNISDSHFISKNEWNAGYGSPWTELNKLTQAVNEGNAYASAHTPFNYMGEKGGMMGLLNRIHTACIDAKWSVTYYHDYVQRGYDHMYNGDRPDVTFTDAIERETIGNKKQNYDENVVIPEKSIDPW